MADYWRDAAHSVKYIDYVKDEKISAANIKKYLSQSDDIIFSPFSFGGTGAFLCCVDGLVKDATIDENILGPFYRIDAFIHCKSQKKAVELIENGFINHASYTKADKLEEVIDGILSSNFVIVFEDESTAFVFDVKGFEKRSIDEPDNESVIKGSKDGFTEPIRLNTAIIRRHLRSHNLVIKQYQVGKIAKTTLAVVYMNNIAPEKLVAEVIGRVEKMDVNAIISMGQIEDALDGDEKAIFPKMLYTERADKLCANIMNGKVGLLIDGYPVSYIIPSNLAMFMQAPEDYSDKYAYASFVRVIRYLCLAVSLLVPSLYLAIVNYSCEILPSKLAESIMQAKYGVPFSPFVETFAMLIAFEILIEAGLRLPNGIGQAVSIVSGLIVGESAINAKLVSPAVVMVTAIAGITCFVLPYQDFANPMRVMRFGMMIAAQAAGLFGIGIALVYTIIYFNSVESFSLPFLAPFSTGTAASWFKDTLFRRKSKDESKA